MSGSITATQILKAGAALTAVGVAVGTQISAGSSQAINPSTDLIFPTDLIQANRGYYMNIKFQQYVKRAQINSAIVSSLGGIKLPLPNQLVDNKSVEYTPSDLNPLVGSVVDSIARAQNPNFSFSNDLLSMAGSELSLIHI